MIMLDALDYNARYAYAPPVSPVSVHVASIVSIKPIVCRGLGSHCRVKLSDGQQFDCVGTVAEVNAKAQAAMAAASAVQPVGGAHA